jgi:hypothetical protein
MLSHVAKARQAQQLAGLLQQCTRGIAHAMPADVSLLSNSIPLLVEPSTLTQVLPPCGFCERRLMLHCRQCKQTTLIHPLEGTTCLYLVSLGYWREGPARSLAKRQDLYLLTDHSLNIQTQTSSD